MELVLHGVSIRRPLLESVAAVLVTEESAKLVLECAPHWVSFYTGLGYEVLCGVADTTGPNVSLLQRRIR